MKLWDKGGLTDKDIENFTVGRDPQLDLSLAPYDVLGTLAHVTMLASINILSETEFGKLKEELLRIYRETERGAFKIEEGIEDVHTQLEIMLTGKLGETGKKVHAGRSRNDQVLLDLHLYIRDGIKQLSGMGLKLFGTLCKLSEQHKSRLMPGYTHFQVAMPSSFGLWFASFAEDLTDDMILLNAAYKVAGQNPLGSAAGFGTSIPVKRQMTTELLGFESLRFNVMHAMMSRGKLEKVTAQALSSLAGTLARLSLDVCTYMGQNYGFLRLADEFTTGSSIMPHKKNPDVFELIRGKCNKIQALHTEMLLITNNLPSGYHRDFQLLKENSINAFEDVKDILDIFNYAIKQIIVKDIDLNDEKYHYLFTVDSINNLVIDGMSFREAYQNIGSQVQNGTYKPDLGKEHSHIGSIHNLCLEAIRAKFPE